MRDSSNLPRVASWAAFALGLAVASIAGATIADFARAQPYARFDVPDSERAAALTAGRVDYENAWNALLVAEIRASLARADSTQRLVKLERAIAEAEPAALGSRIAPDALALRRRWKKEQLRTRVGAAVAESLAAAARTARNYDGADSLLQRALGHYQALRERRREAWVLGSLGANALVARRYEVAIGYYDEALRARRALGDSLLIGNTLSDLGQTHFQLGHFEEARRSLTEAAAIRETQRRWAQLGATLNFLGLTLASLGNPDSAITVYRRSLLLTSGAGDSARTLVVLTNFGLLLTNHGRISDALAILERARALAVGRGESSALIEDNIGHLYRTIGQYSKALEHTDRAIEQFRAAGDSQRMARSMTNRAWVLINTGELARAQRVLAEARAVADSLADPELQGRVYNTIALAAQELGDGAGAERMAQLAHEASTAAEDKVGIRDAMAMLGYVAASRKDAVAVEHCLLEALAAGKGLRPEVRANDLTALATARQLQGRYDEAERGHREALQIATEHENHNQAMWSLCCLGDLEERQGRFAAALDYYGRATAIAETLRTVQRTDRGAITLFASRLFMFDAMIHLLGKLEAREPGKGHAEQAFAWAERSRARAFLDLVTATGANAPSPPLATLADARELLSSDREALLEYSVGDSSTSLWVIRRSGWKYFQLPPRSIVRARVETLRRGLANPAAATEATQRAQHALYALAVAPAESALTGVDHLIIASDGPLSFVPFEALLARPDASQGSHLIERYAISYTPSASVLATRTTRGHGTSLVAIGNPNFGGASNESIRSAAVQLDALPNTAVEIARVRALAGKRAIVTLTGDDASRERTLVLPELATASIIHLATHGDVNDAEPERSGLWLAPDSGSTTPSRIEVADIMQMRLDAGLVTLSACETGLGRLESGEGVVGLSRAFMAAGAQSVIVSLWPVNDLSTARLMEAFYRAALDGRTSRADALARAKRALLANPQTRAPFYWAPFILIGQRATL